MKSKKIVFIIPSLARGGAEYNTIRLANYFTEKNMAVSIISIFDDVPLSSHLNAKVRLEIIKSQKLSASILSIAGLLRAINPDIVISNLWPLNLISYISKLISRKKIRIILVEHINLSLGLKQSKINERILSKIFHFMSRLLGYNFIAVSEGVRQDLIKNFYVSNRSVQTIHNPAIFELPKKTNNLKKFEKIENIKILAVGNLKPQKDYITMLKSISILVSRKINVQLKIAGSGPEYDKIKSCINELNLSNHVLMLGQIESLEDYYLDCDLYLLTSAWEGFGNTIVEALSYGCRVVSTDCPSGPREILTTEEYGVLARVSDANSIAMAIIKSIQYFPDQNLLQKRASEFSQEFIGEKYFNLIV